MSKQAKPRNVTTLLKRAKLEYLSSIVFHTNPGQLGIGSSRPGQLGLYNLIIEVAVVVSSDGNRLDFHNRSSV